jgi:hypothetical protein
MSYSFTVQKFKYQQNSIRNIRRLINNSKAINNHVFMPHDTNIINNVKSYAKFLRITNSGNVSNDNLFLNNQLLKASLSGNFYHLPESIQQSLL